MALFGLAYFSAYAKQLMQINMHLYIIYKLVNVIYEKVQFLLVRTYKLR